MTETKEQTRKSLISKKMGFNQMRNSIFWLQRYMHLHHFPDEEIKRRLRRMGRNIGATFVKEVPTPTSDIDSIIKELYLITVRSKVHVTKEDNLVRVKDSNSALDKYQYQDIHVSGDEIIIAAIAEMLERLGYHINEFKVVECRSFGNKNSIHEYIMGDR